MHEAAVVERGTFESVLFDGPDEPAPAAEPPCFRDLNLDRVVDAIVAGREEYDLRPFFHAPLRDVDLVAYRHEVFRDFERDEIAGPVRAFGERMRRVRAYRALAAKQHYEHARRRWTLDAALGYCEAVTALDAELAAAVPRSRGLRGLGAFLARYARSEPFGALSSSAHAVADDLGRVRYALRIKGARVTVGAYEGEPDYSVEIARAFARFRQGEVESHLLPVSDSGSMDHVEARIVQLVERLHPRPFRALAAFCASHADFFEPHVARFDREAQFYLAVLEHVRRLGARGVEFCYPDVLADAGAVHVERGADVALAGARADRRVVPNDVSLRRPERVLVVTGPNQGGKTTFARMVGQLHHLAALGVPVPARVARLPLADAVHTHFEREEDVATLRGKLDDELVRVREILERATDRSVVILNESFGSTTLADARLLGSDVLTRIADRGCVAVFVTFVDELASLGPATVSMVAGVEPRDPSIRTYEVVRRPADGRAYAWAIADKYGLSRERLSARLRR